MDRPVIHNREFTIRYSEVGRGEVASPLALLGLLEEAGASHCEESGWGIFRLMHEGIGWILLRGALDVRRYPRYREHVRAETWVSSSRRISAEREYRLLGNGGEVLANARAMWLFFNLERRRPLPIIPEILAAWNPGGAKAIELPLDEVEGPALVDGPEFDVRPMEIDTNGHVNHLAYLAWALEAIGQRDGLSLRRLQGQFKREIKLGARVLPRTFDEGGGRIRLGVYAREGEPYIAAAAESVWAPAVSD